MQDIFVQLLGEPEGIIVWQLIYATRFTIYLSLIAFWGEELLLRSYALRELALQSWQVVLLRAISGHSSQYRF